MYDNYYECPECGNSWIDRWVCSSFDECTKCKHETAPYESIWLLAEGVEIDYENPISQEAAMLLGIPFTRMLGWYAYRYVPTKKGLELQRCALMADNPDRGLWLSLGSSDDIFSSVLYPVRFEMDYLRCWRAYR